MQNRGIDVDTPICGNCGSTRFEPWEQLDEIRRAAALAILGSNAGKLPDLTQRIYCRRCLHSRSVSDERC